MVVLLVNENNDAVVDGNKTIKSSVSYKTADSPSLEYCYVNSCIIIDYISDTFKKEISDIDTMNVAMMLAHGIITAESDDEKELILKDITDIVNDKSKLNEYLFTHLASIKAWNETTLALKDKDDVSEKEFNELMNKNNEKWQYKAWNDERKVLDIIYAEKENATGGA